jgi:diguanylate cyclase (GGDEF)-like protein
MLDDRHAAPRPGSIRDVDWIRTWWRQPDHYRWLSGYLGSRRLQRFTRLMLAAVVAALGAVPVLMLLSPSGPAHPVGRAVALVVTGCCMVMAAMWLTRWPDHRQSVWFAMVSNICIAAACLVEVDPETGLLGCATFAALAGYVAFFHAAPYLVATLVVAAGTGATCAVEIAALGDPAMAAAKSIVIAIGVLAVPFSGQILVHLLSVDALKSSTDPLTGLRNRRGFSQATADLIAGAAADPLPYFTVVALDLDGFKAANDTFGHATGDRILIAVAHRLREALGGNAVVARTGGDEFLIAEATTGYQARETAERVRRAVADMPWGVTASVGAASVTLFSVDEDGARRMVEQLIETADAAMYECKRARYSSVATT